MPTKVFSCSFSALDCHIIEVQADVSNGMPHFSIVGLGDTSVQESKERVRSGIKNSGMKFSLNRNTINLAPANIRKQGALFDLPIAVSILIETGQISSDFPEKTLFIGEMGLNGDICPVTGILPMVEHAKKNGFDAVYLPELNAQEAAYVKDIKIYPLRNLLEFISISKGDQQPRIQPSRNLNGIYPRTSGIFENIIDMEITKRVLVIAAAGGHNVLLQGTPGCGKTVISRALKELLPPMKENEIFDTTKIYSVAGLLKQNQQLISIRPFREVHHTASIVSIIGGGQHLRPGEISLAHNGVLMLDEIAEFPKSTLEALRQPLEDRYITINRAKYVARFPANFMLIATMNPCPCGFYGDDEKKCKCSATEISKYQKKISGPLLDRFDIVLRTEKSNMNKIFKDTSHESGYLTGIRQNIKKARKIQLKRFEQCGKSIMKNADMNIKQVKKYCKLDSISGELLSSAVKKINISNRGYLKILKLARTIADLDECEQISERHLLEALQYRR